MGSKILLAGSVQEILDAAQNLQSNVIWFSLRGAYRMVMVGAGQTRPLSSRNSHSKTPKQESKCLALCLISIRLVSCSLVSYHIRDIIHNIVAARSFL